MRVWFLLAGLLVGGSVTGGVVVSGGAPAGGSGKAAPVPAFFAVHCEAGSANPVNWEALGRFVTLAERYEARLTLMFNPQWAEFILADAGRFERVKAWQKAGHEVALHYHTIRHGDWCGYTNRPEWRTRPRYRGSVSDMMALLRKLAAPEPVLSGCCGIDVGSAEVPGSSIAEGLIDPPDFPDEILYDVDGIRDGLAAPLHFTYGGKERIHFRHRFLDPRRPESLEEIKTDAGRARPGQVLGVVTHEMDFARAPGLIEECVRFLQSRGIAVRTVRDIATHDVTTSRPHDLTTKPPHNPTTPFGLHPASVPPDVAGGDPWACARELGVRWHRPVVYAFWFLCQEQREDGTYGNFHWDRLDEIVRGTPPGVRIVWNLSPRNRTPQGSFLPEDLEAYRRYVRAVVERYDGDGDGDAPGCPSVSHWQVENEPALPSRKWQGSAESYAALLEATYRAAKEADPKCTVLIGGVSGSVLRGHDELGDLYLPVLRRLKGKGFDAFDYHWFGNARGDYRKFGEHYRQARRALDQNGYRRVPIWMLECGTYSGAPRAHGGLPLQTEEEQAADLVRRYVHFLSLGVEKILWAFGLVEGFGPPDGDFFDGTGLVYDGIGWGDRGRGVRKASYAAYRLLAEKVGAKPFTGEVKGLPKHAFAYRFGKGPEQVIVVWRDWWHEAVVASRTVPLPFEGEALAIPAVPDPAGHCRTVPIRPEKGSLLLDVGKVPLYVEPRR